MTIWNVRGYYLFVAYIAAPYVVITSSKEDVSEVSVKTLCIEAEFLFGFFVLYASGTNSQLIWEIQRNNIIIGNSVTLVCLVPENTCPVHYVRRWFGGPGKNLLCLNNRSSNKTKYKMSVVNVSNSFDLTIYDFNENDIECEYECSCGFESYRNTLNLQQIKNKLLYPVDRWLIYNSIRLRNLQLNVQFSINKVYPQPMCRLLINDKVFIEIMNFSATYEDHTLLPGANFSGQITINDFMYKATVKIECVNPINISAFLVVQETVKNVVNFNDSSVPRINHLLYEAISCGGLVICLGLLSYVFCNRIKHSIRRCGTSGKSKSENITKEETIELYMCTSGEDQNDINKEKLLSDAEDTTNAKSNEEYISQAEFSRGFIPCSIASRHTSHIQ